METKVSHYKNLIIKTVLSDEVLTVEAVDILTRLVYLQEWNIKENNLIDFKKLCDTIADGSNLEASIESSENEVTIKCGCVVLNVICICKYSIPNFTKPTKENNLVDFKKLSDDLYLEASTESKETEISVESDCVMSEVNIISKHSIPSSDGASPLWTYTKECDFEEVLITENWRKIHQYTKRFVREKTFKNIIITFQIPYVIETLSGKVIFKMCFDSLIVSQECKTREDGAGSFHLRYVAENIQAGEHQIGLFVKCENAKVIIPCSKDLLKNKDPKHRGYIKIIGE